MTQTTSASLRSKPSYRGAGCPVVLPGFDFGGGAAFRGLEGYWIPPPPQGKGLPAPPTL